MDLKMKTRTTQNQSTVKLPTDFLDEIKTAAKIEYRSASQQLLYWAKLGQQVAMSYLSGDDDEELGKHVLSIYEREKHLITKVNINDL